MIELQVHMIAQLFNSEHTEDAGPGSGFGKSRGEFQVSRKTTKHQNIDIFVNEYMNSFLQRVDSYSAIITKVFSIYHKISPM